LLALVAAPYIRIILLKTESLLLVTACLLGSHLHRVILHYTSACIKVCQCLGYSYVDMATNGCVCVYVCARMCVCVCLRVCVCVCVFIAQAILECHICLLIVIYV